MWNLLIWQKNEIENFYFHTTDDISQTLKKNRLRKEICIQIKTYFNCSIRTNSYHHFFSLIIIHFSCSLTCIIEWSQRCCSGRNVFLFSKNKTRKLTHHFPMFLHNHYKYVELFHSLIMEELFVYKHIYHIQLDHIFGSDAKSDPKKPTRNVLFFMIMIFKPVLIPFVFDSTLHVYSRKMANDISDNNHFHSILVFHYV